MDCARLEVHQPDANQRSSLLSGSARSSGCSPGSHQTPLTLERALLPVEDRLDAADEPVAVEDGQDVVAVLPLRRRDVHLEPVVEVPERLGAGAVVDEPVERGEERRAGRDRRVLGLRVRDQPAALEPHAERAEALLREQLLGAVGQRIVSVSGYQRPARSQTRCLPRRPTTATSPRAARISSISPILRAPHQSCCSRSKPE